MFIQLITSDDINFGGYGIYTDIILEFVFVLNLIKKKSKYIMWKADF